jgi:hypothetical protein
MVLFIGLYASAFQRGTCGQYTQRRRGDAIKDTLKTDCK